MSMTCSHGVPRDAIVPCNTCKAAALPTVDGVQLLYSWLDFHYDCRDIIEQIRASGITLTGVVGIPRGGLVLALVLSHAFTIPMHVRSSPESHDPTTWLVCDDNVITGGVLNPFIARGMPCAVLVKHPIAQVCLPFFCARESDEVFLFPWEAESVKHPIPLDTVVYNDCDDPANPYTV